MTISETLRAQIKKHETTNQTDHGVLPFGILQIDDHLPEHGIKFGALHEVTGGGNGSQHRGAAILYVAGMLARTKGQILWCVKQRDLFAPALAQVGIDTDRILFVDAGDEKSVLACMEEGLRHGGLAAVVGEVSQLSLVASRRLQLAAESTGALCFAIWRWRTAVNCEQWGQNTAARSSWRVTALPGAARSVQGLDRARWRVELMRCRGGETAQFDVEACDAQGYLGVPAVLADRQAAQAAG